MCIVCQAAIAGAAAITGLLPVTAVPQQHHAFTPDVVLEQPAKVSKSALAAVPNLSGRCPRPGLTRTVRGVLYECTKSSVWQDVSRLSDWEWRSTSIPGADCVQPGSQFTISGSGFSTVMKLPAVFLSPREVASGKLPPASQVTRAVVRVLSEKEAVVTVPAQSKFRIAPSASIGIIVSAGPYGGGGGWGSAALRWCGTNSSDGSNSDGNRGDGRNNAKTPTTTPKTAAVVVPAISTTLVSNIGNSKTAKFLGIRSGLPGARTEVPVIAVSAPSATVCKVTGEIVEFLGEGNCDLRVAVGTNATGVRVVVKRLLPRTTIDRPGGNVLDIKPLYITFKNGVDDRHDTEGLVATLVTNMADFFAEQHPGFEMRVDTYDGLPDIQFVELPVTREEFLANWNSSYGPLPKYLKQLGFDINVDDLGAMPLSYDATRRIYVGIVESVTGGRQGPGFASGHNSAFCGGEALPGGGVMVYVRDSQNNACTQLHATLRYNGSTDRQYDFANFRRIYGGTGLRSIPGCESIFREHYMKRPDETDEALVKKNDPVYYPQYGGKAPPWVMDEDRRFYLRITNGPRAGNPCWDVAYSPFLMRMGSQVGQDDVVAGRVTADQPDDSTAPQVKAFYVLAADSVDDRYDVGGQIARQITSANEWLFTNGGKRVRWDTYKGQVDVQFVRLKESEAELWMDPADPSKKCRYKQCPTLETLVLAMQAQGFATRGKVTAVFYGGQRTFASQADVQACAWGGWGRAGYVSMYLVADMNVMTGGIRCSSMTEYATPTNSVNTVGLAMIHELFHVIGAVAWVGPPNSDGYGHIKNDTTDLMGGSQGIVRLDPGNDDYWRHGRGYVDAYRSALMEPAEPNAVLPENWGRANSDS